MMRLCLSRAFLFSAERCRGNVSNMSARTDSNSGVETVEYDGTKYAEIIWADTQVDHTTFFSPPQSSFQFGLLAHKAGFIEPPHYHKPISRTITDLQQMFVVQ